MNQLSTLGNGVNMERARLASIAPGLSAAALVLAVELIGELVYLPDAATVRCALFTASAALAALLALTIYVGRGVLGKPGGSRRAGILLTVPIIILSAPLMMAIAAQPLTLSLFNEVGFSPVILLVMIEGGFAGAIALLLIVSSTIFIALPAKRFGNRSLLLAVSIVAIFLLVGGYLAFLHKTNVDREAILTRVLARAGVDNCDIGHDRLLDDTLRVARRALRLDESAGYDEALAAAFKLPERTRWVLAADGSGDGASLDQVLSRLCRADRDVTIELRPGRYVWNPDLRSATTLGLAAVGSLYDRHDEGVRRATLLGPTQGVPAILELGDTFVIGGKDEVRGVTFTQKLGVTSGGVMINGDGGALRDSIIQADSGPGVIVALNSGPATKHVRIEDNVISSKQDSGIYLYEREAGSNDDVVISGNDISHVAKKSFDIGEGNVPTFARNVVKPE